MTSKAEVIEQIDKLIEHLAYLAIRTPSEDTRDAFQSALAEWKSQFTELLSPVLPEEVDNFCRELSWSRFCDYWELDAFLIDINKDRAKAVELIERLQSQVSDLEKQNELLLDDVLKFQKIANAKKSYRRENEELQARLDECEAALRGPTLD